MRYLAHLIQKKNDSEISESKIKNEVQKVSLFIDKYIKSKNMVKGVSINNIDVMNEAVEQYADISLDEQEKVFVNREIEIAIPLINEFADSKKTLASLESAKDLNEATNLLKSNFKESTRINSVLTAEKSSNEKEVIDLLHKQINDDIEQELVNAYLFNDENISEANMEVLYESKTEQIKNKISKTISDFRSGLLINSQGLSLEQINLLSMSTMVANEQIQDEMLIDNLDDIASTVLFGSLDQSVVSTKGFFKSIGKFFSKVIKTAIVVVGVAVLAVTAAISSPVANVMIGLPLTIQLIRSSKSIYNWVGWNNWSKW